MSFNIVHNRVELHPHVKNAMVAAINSGKINLVQDVHGFERKFEKVFNLERNSCIGVASGSAALFILLRALSPEYSNIEIPLYTCPSLTKAAELAGFRVSYSDSISGYLPLFSSASKDGSISLVPHMCGVESKVEETGGNICIEDATQIIGSRNKAGYAGFSSGYSVLSFYATKGLTTGGQGGIIYARDKIIAERARRLVSAESDFKQMGINLRMQGLNALAGSKSLDLLQQEIRARMSTYLSYLRSGLELVSYPVYQTQPSYYRSLFFANGRALEIVKTLNKKGIQIIQPYEAHELPSFCSVPSNTLSILNGLISLPAHSGITQDDTRIISREILSSMERF